MTTPQTTLSKLFTIGKKDYIISSLSPSIASPPSFVEMYIGGLGNDTIMFVVDLYPQTSYFSAQKTLYTVSDNWIHNNIMLSQLYCDIMHIQKPKGFVSMYHTDVVKILGCNRGSMTVYFEHFTFTLSSNFNCIDVVRGHLISLCVPSIV